MCVERPRDGFYWRIAICCSALLRSSLLREDELPSAVWLKCTHFQLISNYFIKEVIKVGRINGSGEQLILFYDGLLVLLGCGKKQAPVVVDFRDKIRVELTKAIVANTMRV